MKVRVDRISVGGHNLLLSIPYKCKSIGLTNSFRHFEYIVSPSSTDFILLPKWKYHSL